MKSVRDPDIHGTIFRRWVEYGSKRRRSRADSRAILWLFWAPFRQKTLQKSVRKSCSFIRDLTSALLCFFRPSGKEIAKQLWRLGVKARAIANELDNVDPPFRLGRVSSNVCCWMSVCRTAIRRSLRYLWFGSEPGSPLPDLGSKIARHSKANSVGTKTERPMHREVSKAKFEALNDINQLVERLFGMTARVQRLHRRMR
jgi:hypothetical protein